MGRLIQYLRGKNLKSYTMETLLNQKVVQAIPYAILLSMAALGIAFFIIGLLNMAN